MSPGGDYYADSAPGGHDGTHQRARGELGQHRALRHGRDALGGRGALPGQDALVALEARRRQQAQIGGDHSSHGQSHDVARHELGDVDLVGRAPTHDHDDMADRRMQRLGGPFGAVLIDETQPDRRREDHADDHSVGSFADQERHECGHHQEHQQRAGQLSAQHRPRLGVVRTHGIRTHCRAAAEHFSLGESAAVAAQGVQHCVRRKDGGLGHRYRHVVRSHRRGRS